jgi:glycyl-tRNA synthetase beta subunit
MTPGLYALLHDLLALHPHRNQPLSAAQREIYDTLHSDVLSSLAEGLFSANRENSLAQLEDSERRLLIQIDKLEREQEVKALKEAGERVKEAMDQYVSALEGHAREEGVVKLEVEEAEVLKRQAKQRLEERTREFEDLKRLMD